VIQGDRSQAQTHFRLLLDRNLTLEPRYSNFHRAFAASQPVAPGSNLSRSSLPGEPTARYCLAANDGLGPGCNNVLGGREFRFCQTGGMPERRIPLRVCGLLTCVGCGTFLRRERFGVSHPEPVPTSPARLAIASGIGTRRRRVSRCKSNSASRLRCAPRRDNSCPTFVLSFRSAQHSTSGHTGGSYGSSKPARWWISPVLARR